MIDEVVVCNFILSKRTVDILNEMAEEDCVSMRTEVENAISGWYRMRHGFSFPDEARKELEKQLKECSCLQIDTAEKGH